jgi:hypothetical protein
MFSEPIEGESIKCGVCFKQQELAPIYENPQTSCHHLMVVRKQEAQSFGSHCPAKLSTMINNQISNPKFIKFLSIETCSEPQNPGTLFTALMVIEYRQLDYIPMLRSKELIKC